MSDDPALVGAESRHAAGSHDSPRWCGYCRAWGDHHTDRCPVDVVKQMPQYPQRQDALDDQIRDVRVVANRMGCYDAADWIGRKV